MRNAYQAVTKEVRSAVVLAGRLLETVFAAETLSSEFRLKESVMELMQDFDQVRHVRLHISCSRGDFIWPASEAEFSARAPAWFTALVEPFSLEFRHVFSLGREDPYEIVIRAEPADEVAEVWREARRLLGLLVLFAIAVNAAAYWILCRALHPLDILLAAFDKVERGAFDVRLLKSRLPDWDRVFWKFNAMAAALERSRHENRKLARRSLAIQEEERRSLARELHDDWGQAVSAIQVLAASILQEEEERLSAPIAEKVATIRKTVGHIYQGMREMTCRLRPAVLDELGLVSALQQLVYAWNRRESTVCTLAFATVVDTFPDPAKTHIYRIIQEALTNVTRHARASQVHVCLQHHDESIALLVQDNGRGFDLNAPCEGLGLLGIRERAEALCGEFRLRSVRGKGTVLQVIFPLPKGSEG